MNKTSETSSTVTKTSDINNNRIPNGNETVILPNNNVANPSETAINTPQAQGNIMTMPVALPYSGLTSMPLTFCAVNGVGGTGGVLQPGVQPGGIILLNMGGTTSNNIQSNAQIVTCGNQIDQNQIAAGAPSVLNQIIANQQNAPQPQMVIQPQQPQVMVPQSQLTIQQTAMQHVQQNNGSIPTQPGAPSGYMLVPIHQVPVNQQLQPTQQPTQTLQQPVNVVQQPINTINQVPNTSQPPQTIQQNLQTLTHQPPIQVFHQFPAQPNTPTISTVERIQDPLKSTTTLNQMSSLQQQHISLPQSPMPVPNKNPPNNSNIIPVNLQNQTLLSSLFQQQPQVLHQIGQNIQLVQNIIPSIPPSPIPAQPQNVSVSNISNPNSPFPNTISSLLPVQQPNVTQQTVVPPQVTLTTSAGTSALPTPSPINDPHISSSELPPSTPNLGAFPGINPLLISAMMKLSRPQTSTPTTGGTPTGISPSEIMEMMKTAMAVTIEGGSPLSLLQQTKTLEQQNISNTDASNNNVPVINVACDTQPQTTQATTSVPVAKASTPNNFIIQSVLPSPNEEKDKPVKRKRGPAPKLDGNEVCSICSDKASGYHYGVLSCEGCKGFFRRSVIHKKIYRCKNEGKCQMDSFMRRKCQKCRLEKCRLTGMKEEGVLSEDGTAKKKVKKENKEKESAFVASPQLFAPNLSFTGEPVPSLSSQQRNLVEMLQANETRFQWPSEEDVARVTAWVETGDSHRSRASRFAHFTELAILIVQLVVEFTKQLPGFLTVTREDQITLLKACTIEVMLLRAAKQYDMNTGSINFLNGQFYNKSSFYRAGMQVEFVDPIFDFCNSMARLKLDEAEIAMLVAINTFSPDRLNIKDMKKVEAVQDSYVELLRVYLKIHHPSDPLMFPRVLMKLVELRTLNNYHSEQIFALKVQDKQLPPLLAEIWDM